MNLVELDHALRKLRLSGMADVLEARLRHAQTEKLAPLDPSPRSSATSCSVGKTGCLTGGTSRPASATRIGRSIGLTSISTRR